MLLLNYWNNCSIDLSIENEEDSLNWLILMFKNDFFKATYCQLIYEFIMAWIYFDFKINCVIRFYNAQKLLDF